MRTAQYLLWYRVVAQHNTAEEKGEEEGATRLSGMRWLVACVRSTEVPDGEVHPVWPGWQISTVWLGTRERGGYKGEWQTRASWARSSRAKWGVGRGEGEAEMEDPPAVPLQYNAVPPLYPCPVERGVFCGVLDQQHCAGTYEVQRARSVP